MNIVCVESVCVLLGVSWTDEKLFLTFNPLNQMAEILTLIKKPPDVQNCCSSNQQAVPWIYECDKRTIQQ